MRANFNAALQFVLDHECVFAAGHHGDMAHVVCEQVPGDHGGLTKFGIDQRSHPNVNIKALSFEQARYLYQENEWERCRCDELPAGYDLAVFDTAVNCGCGTSATLLQSALNYAHAGEEALEVDGFIGAKTLRAAGRAGHAGLAWFLELRGQRYLALVAHDSTQQKFLQGWLDRIKDLRVELSERVGTAEGALVA